MHMNRFKNSKMNRGLKACATFQGVCLLIFCALFCQPAMARTAMMTNVQIPFRDLPEVTRLV